MTLVSDTATSIKGVLDTVPDIGATFDYEPFPGAEWQTFISTFTVDIGTRHVRAWTIKNIHRDTVPITISAASEVQRPKFTWLIKGFLGVNQSGQSDRVFRDLLEAVTEALNSRRTLGGANSILDHDPADYDLPNSGALLSLGDTVCHYGEVTFTSTHEITVAVT